MTSSTGSPDTSTRPLAGCGALVTGGSRGIGRAIVRRLAADGATVVFTYHTQSEAADTLIAEIAELNGRAYALQLDLAAPEQVTEVFAAADRAFHEAGAGGLDILVANAGVFTSAPIAETTLDEWERVMAVNGRGTFLALQHAATRMRDGGRIITLSTVGTHWPSQGEALYAASKAAVEQLTRVASRELGHRGITANTLSLGPTDTDLLRAGAHPDALDGAAAMTALGRIGRPDDVAGLVALLVRADNRWVTGQNIRADGGLT
ncbi:3-oxoacyl-[acyl-carrier protein] reductase [Streptomyces sp. 2112.3]|uniref:SDR family oxidoreductase n=1 Tax=Streptomyces sp. 2112.3 TaxID=1881023 RepID=UPI00089B613E|nr:SDR family oxidoreductase [Streptomyces sp. 2112.3]SEF18127.1 3-oxoacyl-[acyl-carrier protein] reductase [Streptomyces sp. 2112.3]